MRTLTWILMMLPSCSLWVACANGEPDPAPTFDDDRPVGEDDAESIVIGTPDAESSVEVTGGPTPCRISFAVEARHVGKVPVGAAVTLPPVHVRSTCSVPVVLEMPDILTEADGTARTSYNTWQIEPFLDDIVTPTITVGQPGSWRLDCLPGSFVEKSFGWSGTAE